jgi:hypothetical protein
METEVEPQYFITVYLQMEFITSGFKDSWNASKKSSRDDPAFGHPCKKDLLFGSLAILIANKK